MHFFNYYGFYTGSYYPKESLVSGRLLIKQVEHYSNKVQRIEIAKRFIDAASYNIYRNLTYYNNRGKDLKQYMKEIEYFRKQINLCKDVQDFKPIIADRLIFSMMNKNQISEKDFEEGLNFLYIKEKARKEITRQMDLRLQTTIKHKTLDREVSYEYLIRLEIYKLIKHLLEDVPYEGFKMWW